MGLNNGLNAGGLRPGGCRRVTTFNKKTGQRVVDSFEDQDMTEWQDYEQNGGITGYDIVKPSGFTAQEGEYVLQLADDTTYPRIASTTGLANYPEQGEEWWYWTYIDTPVGSSTSSSGSGDSGIYFGLQDIDNTYFIQLRPYDDFLNLSVKDAGVTTELAQATDIGLARGNWYQVHFTWDDGSFGGTAGDITVTVEDETGTQVASITANDTTYTQGGVGLWAAAGTGNAMYFDHFHTRGKPETTSMVDDYEDGEMAEYEDHDGVWDTNEVQFATSPVYSGDSSVFVEGTPGGQKLISTNGLDIYPKQGDEFEFYGYLDGTVGAGSGQLATYFGVQDGANHYYVDVRWYNDEVRLHKNGSYVANAQSVGLTGQAWHRFRVQWDDGSTFGGVAGDITIIVEDDAGTQLASFTANDTEYTEGGVGHYAFADAGEYVVWDKHEVLNRSVETGGTRGDVIETFESTNFDAYTRFADSGYQTFGFTDSQSKHESIGGGPGYPNTISESETTFTASTSSELRSNLTSAAAGSIVYVTGDIDTVGEQPVTVPAGVTLASNRGIDGQPGHKIKCGQRNRGIILREDSRITGLRVEGPHPDRWSPDLDHSQNNSEWHQKGVNMTGDNAEVDNNEIYGFGYSCVQNTRYDTTRNPNDCHIHHNHIHHGISDGWGYGYDNSDGKRNTVEYNKFSHCRHATVAVGGSYELYHNLVEEPNANNIFDMHQPGGDYMDIRRNTVVGWQTNLENQPSWVSGNRAVSAVIQRENPNESVEVHNNWLWNPYPPPPDAPLSSGFDYTAIDQAWPVSNYDGSSWQGVNFSNNVYGGETRAASDRRMMDGRQVSGLGERSLVYYGSDERLGYLSTTGLQNYPSAGDTWRFFFRGEGWPFRLAQVFFGVQSETSPQDCYEIEIWEDEIRLEVDNAGTDTTLARAAFDWWPMIPYEIVVDWPSDPTNNGITVTVNNWQAGTQEVSMTGTADDSFLDGGIGFYGNSQAGFLLDDFEILS